MAFKTFAPGVLTSSDVNTFLMRQAVITCTSSTRPASPSEGMTIYETDTDLYQTYSGSAWEDGFKSGEWITYTVTIRSGGTGTDWDLGNATTQGRYQRVGRLIVGHANITFGSTSVYGSKNLLIVPPVPIDTRAVDTQPIGVSNARDDSAGDGYIGVMLQAASDTTAMRPALTATSGTYATRGGLTSTTPFSWTTGDQVSVLFSYEAGSA